ncbi:MAG: hypothetical protein HZA24_01470 [Nitrospirae bacterium]|nr:hypothetical protein [Nitrospirota bacterium]
MSEREEPLSGNQRLTELFAALKEVVADNPHIQEMIRLQEQDNRQVLLNMSSVLRMVEQDMEGDDQEAVFEPRAIAGWMAPEPADPVVGAERPLLNFFDRAFLRSLKISH